VDKDCLIRFAWTLSGILITSVLIAGAVLTVRSYTEPGGIARIGFTFLAIVGEILIIVSMMTMTDCIALGKLGKAVMAALVWVLLACISCYACSQWFKETLSHDDIKQIDAQSRIKTIDSKLALEQQHLETAAQLALSGKTAMLRDGAKAEADATRKRILDLESQRQWPAQIVTAGSVNNIIHGYELEATVAWFVLSQICWFFGLNSTDRNCHAMKGRDRSRQVTLSSDRSEAVTSPVTDHDNPINIPVSLSSSLSFQPMDPVSVTVQPVTGAEIIPFHRLSSIQPPDRFDISSDRGDRDDGLSNAKIANLRQKGLSWRQIADKLSVSESTARRMLKNETKVKCDAG
jgi:hypothetical protein